MDEPMVRELASALRVMKDHHGRKLAYGTIQKMMERGLGGFAISTGAGVATYFDPDTIPEHPNVPNVLSMIEAMGFEIDDLPPEVAAAIREDLRGLRDLLARNAWFGTAA